MAAIFPANCFLRSPFAKFLADLDFTLIDVGMRGGAEPDLLPIAFATHVIGFEPEPRAYAALAAADSGPWRSRTVHQMALGRDERSHRLFVTDDPQSSSVLAPDPAFGESYGKPQFFNVDHSVEVRGAALDAVLAETGASAPGFLKLDVEGAEADVLAGAEATLSATPFVKIEVSTLPFNRGQPVFGEVDRLLATAGFRLFDLLALNRWRRDGHVIHPHLARGRYAYSRGSLMHGDALYVREIFPGGQQADDHALALRGVAVLLAYGYFDHALAILQQDAVDARMRREYGIDPADAISLVSARFGRQAWLRAFGAHLRATATFVRSGLRGLLR